uniref:Uncharacterized protein n=1 Tax=Oryza brachyantha TaxID=4533 RepID=J3M862_ORYBR
MPSANVGIKAAAMQCDAFAANVYWDRILFKGVIRIQARLALTWPDALLALRACSSFRVLAHFLDPVATDVRAVPMSLEIRTVINKIIGRIGRQGGATWIVLSHTHTATQPQRWRYSLNHNFPNRISFPRQPRSNFNRISLPNTAYGVQPKIGDPTSTAFSDICKMTQGDPLTYAKTLPTTSSDICKRRETRDDTEGDTVTKVEDRDDTEGDAVTKVEDYPSEMQLMIKNQGVGTVGERAPGMGLGGGRTLVGDGSGSGRHLRTLNKY